MQLLQLDTQSAAAASSARGAAKHSLKVLSRLYEQFGSYDDAVIFRQRPAHAMHTGFEGGINRQIA